LPTFCVTHDPVEAFALCDEVLGMERGRFVRQGTPDGIFAGISTTLAAEGHSWRWNGQKQVKNTHLAMIRGGFCR
jgi:ABC-type sulfate/molybdate transport systems ATPase subunit